MASQDAHPSTRWTPEATTSRLDQITFRATGLRTHVFLDDPAIVSVIGRVDRTTLAALRRALEVAARADRHYLISKKPVNGGRRMVTRVAEIGPDKRREEIARMLAGAEITAEARAAAERLIRAAG